MTIKLVLGALTSILVFSACQTETAPEASAQTAEEPVFTEAVRDHKCDLLTMEDVAAATGLPASAIEERMSGCFYSWKGDQGRPEGTLYLGSLRVHDTVDRARRNHARYTQDVSAEETEQAKERVQGDLAEQQAESDITPEEEAAASSMVGAMPDMDFTHRELPGVGNEAVMDNRGSAYVRVGNVTIQFSGKTDGEDRLDPDLVMEVGRRIVATLEAL